ncbi:MAG: hypothetical protein ABSH20_04520 [Tepidisphaeraceae bacterium]|jgi:hypothetical protein
MRKVLAVLCLVPMLTGARERGPLLAYALKSAERVAQSADDPERSNASSRDLFAASLIYLEAGGDVSRVKAMLEVAAKMQDRDETSKTYGNFRWNWNRPEIVDRNAVDFCMEGGSLIWLRHRDKLPAGIREPLKKMLELGTEGCMRHRVGDSYTNIALMSAANLVLLGEGLDNPKATEEGLKRLDAAVKYTLANGTHEYDSPTYYGVDLDVLGVLEAQCKSDAACAQAKRLLDLFWTDIAASYFPGGKKLTGPNSRTYDYLRGLGNLDNHLWYNGWIDGPPVGSFGIIWPLLGRYEPGESIRKISDRVPRLVRQSWGSDKQHARTLYVLNDIALGSSAACYGGWMDMPLTVDFPGPRESVRGYYIPDGRGDPYGKLKIMEKSGHEKALHLNNFFTSAQSKTDALALAVYREKDYPDDYKSLQTHWVMPRDVDQIIVNGKAITHNQKQWQVVVPAGAPVIFRKGSAAVAVCFPWSRDCAGKPATLQLIDDGNSYGAVRLTLDHHVSADQPAAPPAAIIAVSVGSGLNDASFAAWARAIEAQKCDVSAGAAAIRATVTTTNGVVTISAKAPFKVPTDLIPAPPRAVLEIDGVDVGKSILQ